ncbi:ATP-binding protein [Streptomyces pinistramenti]|uniref:ATP-binding protein n=1 Tax=Streptomyces pinistramenti TaxID=2884812 RepID=UPI001D07E4EE|nr:ATP-binding protein [Streptomyces pinistramenti]MCB5908328.1 ATP-binding protein [Streptomyces pinistramenti]
MSKTAAPPFRRTTARFVVPNSNLAPKIMRDLVKALLVATGHPALVDDARVCVSEVITNVHLHTHTTLVYLDVTLLHPEGVLFAAWGDDSWSPRFVPTWLNFRGDEERGRGLLLVRSCPPTGA